MSEEDIIKRLAQLSSPVIGPRLGEFLSLSRGGVYVFINTTYSRSPRRILSVFFARADVELEKGSHFILN